MRINLLLFSQLKDALGSEALDMELPDDASTQDLIEVLAEQYPIVNRLRDHIRVAVNARYAANDQVISDGDTIALITPVSGG